MWVPQMVGRRHGTETFRPVGFHGDGRHASVKGNFRTVIARATSRGRATSTCTSASTRKSTPGISGVCRRGEGRVMDQNTRRGRPMRSTRMKEEKCAGNKCGSYASKCEPHTFPPSPLSQNKPDTPTHPNLSLVSTGHFACFWLDVILGSTSTATTAKVFFRTDDLSISLRSTFDHSSSFTKTKKIGFRPLMYLPSCLARELASLIDFGK